MSDQFDISNEINKLETKVNDLRKNILENLNPLAGCPACPSS